MKKRVRYSRVESYVPKNASSEDNASESTIMAVCKARFPSVTTNMKNEGHGTCGNKFSEVTDAPSENCTHEGPHARRFEPPALPGAKTTGTREKLNYATVCYVCCLLNYSMPVKPATIQALPQATRTATP